MPWNSSPLAGPNGAAVFIALGWSSDDHPRGTLPTPQATLTSDGPVRLGDRERFGGESVFPGGFCTGVPASGYRCWRAPEAVAPSNSVAEADPYELTGHMLDRSVKNLATGAERPLPNVGSLPTAVRVRGGAVDILTEKSWYTWDGRSITPRAYDPARLHRE